MVTTIELKVPKKLLSEEEWFCIESFKYRAEKLAKTKLYNLDNRAVNANMSYTKGQGLIYKTQLPPEEVITDYLLAFRHFCLIKEPGYFLRILKIFGKYIQDQEARNALKVVKGKWKNALFNDAMQISLNNEKITAFSLIDIWFNGEYFHSDLVKNKKLTHMKDAFPNDFYKFMLVDAVMESSKIIIMLAHGMQDFHRQPSHT